MSLTFPRLVLLEDWRTYRLEGSWTYSWVAEDGKRRELILPDGYRTDLASVPRILHSLISPFDLRQASLPHDLIYGFGGVLPPEHFRIDGLPCADPWTRRDTDRLFARLMREAGVARWRRRAAYRAVRLFGWQHWRATK